MYGDDEDLWHLYNVNNLVTGNYLTFQFRVKLSFLWKTFQSESIFKLKNEKTLLFWKKKKKKLQQNLNECKNFLKNPSKLSNNWLMMGNNFTNI